MGAGASGGPVGLARTEASPADASQRIAEPGDGVAWREEHGRVVLERPAAGARRLLLRLARQPASFTVRLDEVGSAAWRLVDGRRTVGAIHAELARRFPAEADLASRLGRFVGMLASRGLLRLR